MKYEKMNWLVVVTNEMGGDHYIVFTSAYHTLEAATKEMRVQLDNDPDVDVELTMVTEAMRDDWRREELEYMDQQLLSYAR